jgi:hypothetical protein
MKPMREFLMLILMSVCGRECLTAAEVVGTCVIPHRMESAMRYRKPPDPDLAARVQLFIKGPATPGEFDGRKPAQLLASGDWAWHDLATAVPAPEGALTVWSFNGKSARWGCGQSFRMEAEGLSDQEIAIKAPASWISAATFLSSDGAPQPDRVLIHVANDSDVPLELRQLRLWLPKDAQTWQTLWPQPPVDAAVTVPPDALRHSFASYWLPIHADRPRLAELMGNSPAIIAWSMLKGSTRKLRSGRSVMGCFAWNSETTMAERYKVAPRATDSRR